MLDRDLVLPHRIIRLAEEHASSPAIVDVAGPALTWAELRDQFLPWGAGIRAQGVQPGETVVTMLPNSFAAYLAWLGASWIGAIEVPANNMYRGETLSYLVGNSQARVLVIAQRFVDR